MSPAHTAPAIERLGIIGAGIMGRGIAQLAAQAGLRVQLYDVSPDAVRVAMQALEETWSRLAARGKLTEAQVSRALACLQPCDTLQSLSQADAIIEAVVERLDVKQALFRDLEGVVREDCILASNTSSLSITAIAQGCARPQQVAGCHFFNPVPLMKVVEVIDGLRTAPAVADRLVALVHRLGHTPVRASDMPGFVVNHAGRGMNIEGLKLAQEGVAPYHVVDAIMREQAGFRMGPFELLDLTALDVSHPVMESIYRQFYDEPRFRPSPITAVRHAGGLYGRKVGEGFYRYVDGQKQEPAAALVPAVDVAVPVWVAPSHAEGTARLRSLLAALGVEVEEGAAPSASALVLAAPYGEDVASVVARLGLPPARTLAVDAFFGLAQGRRRVLMCSAATEPVWRDVAHALLARDGTPVSVIADSAGFVGQRMVATIINVACDIAQQAIATPGDIDRAVSLGLGYPLGGPLAMGDALGAAPLLDILHAMHRVTGDMRYRASPWLQRRVQLGMALVEAARCSP